MGKEYRNKTILISSLLLSFLIIFVSFFGLFNNQTYSKETINWTIQAIAQDAVDLFIITPFLLLSSSLLYKKNKVALLIWSGTLLYVIYTFVIYCFAVHFNFLFFFYCLTLGISFYLFMYYIFSQIKNPLIKDYNEKIPVKTVGIYLIILACIFYIFWLSEIVPPMLNNLTPKEIIDIGLPINPVHSLDMSIFLPELKIIRVVFSLEVKTR